uniref:IstB_IS21 domain-containing protein n=1 Tax=Elaeophora elaphi TaxID=1147741 RepID=A0A0R3RMN7_9BILA
MLETERKKKKEGRKAMNNEGRRNEYEKLITDNWMVMGGKPLINLLCCHHSRAEDMRDELLSAYRNQSYQSEQIIPDQAIDLLEKDQRIALVNEKCTYKRNESPQPMEAENLKLNGTTL